MQHLPDIFTQPDQRTVLERARDRAAAYLASDGLTTHERHEAGYFFTYAQARVEGMTPEDARVHAEKYFPELVA